MPKGTDTAAGGDTAIPGGSAVHPTDQQAVTVAQIDRQAAALIFPTHAMTIMSGGWDETENVQVFARHRPASVSSASAEVAHPDDRAVELFAARMKTKLAMAREKGRGGWDDPAQCSVAYLRQLLHEHVAKGDPVDVANFCMMLGHYGASTSPEPVPATNQAGEVERLRKALHDIANVRPIGGHCHANSTCGIMEGIAIAALATQPATSQEGEARCPASPDHADIKETIEDAADDWQAKGYTSALAEVRDMAAVGRSLMEALPKGYCYMDSPAEIVIDLQNDLDEALTATPTPPTLSEDLREALSALVVAASEYQEAAQQHISDTRYDEDGNLAARDAELSVVALPRARAALARVKAS